MTPTPYANLVELPPAIKRRERLREEAAEQGRQDEWDRVYDSICQALNTPDHARNEGDELVSLQGTKGAVRLWVAPPLAVCFAVPADEMVVWVHDYSLVPPWPNSGPPPTIMTFNWLLGGQGDFNRIRQQAVTVRQEAAFLATYNEIVRQIRQPEQAVGAGVLLRKLRHPQAQIRVVVEGFLQVYYVVYLVERVGFFFHFEAPGWPEEE